MRAVKNFIILFIGDGLSYLLNFFATVYLARVLEVSNFGKISFAFAFFSFGSFLTNLGLVSIGTRDIAQSNKTYERLSQNKYITDVVMLRQLLAAITFVILLIIAVCINKSQDIKLLIILYSLSLFPFAFLIEWVFIGWEKMLAVTISKIIISVSYFILIFVFIKSPQQLTIIPNLFLVSYILGALFLLIAYFKQKPPQCHCALKSRLSDWLQLLKNALPIGIGAILIQFSLNFNVIFLGLVENSFQVGLFSASTKILFFILIFDRVMNNTTFPIISRYYLDGKEKLSEVLNRLNKLIFAIAMPICVGGFILAKELTIFVYGLKYQPSATILRIIIWFFFITMLNSLYTSTLIAGKKNRAYTTSIGFGVIANVILNLILVPRIGAIGTAIALITAEFVTLIILTQKIKPIAQIRFTFINIIKPVLATLTMLAIIILLRARLTTLPIIAIAGFVYTVTLILIKGINKKDFTLGKIA